MMLIQKVKSTSSPLLKIYKYVILCWKFCNCSSFISFTSSFSASLPTKYRASKVESIQYSTFMVDTVMLLFCKRATIDVLVSGALAERFNFFCYMIFSLFNTLIYCVPAHWIWSTEGWLYKLVLLHTQMMIVSFP